LAKTRINKLALDLNIQNDQIIDALQKKGVLVKNYMSSIDDEAAEYIRDLFSKQTAGKGKKPPSKTTAKTAEPPAKPKAKPATAKTTSPKKASKASKSASKEELELEEEPANLKNKTRVKDVAGKSKAIELLEVEPDIDIDEDELLATPKKKTETKSAIVAKKTKKTAPEKISPPAKVTAEHDEHDDEHKSKKHGLKITKQEDKLKEAHVIPQPIVEQKPAPVIEPVKIKPEVKTEIAPADAVAKETASSQPSGEAEQFEKIQLSDSIAIRDLAEKLKTTANEVIKQLMSLGILATINQSLDITTASKVADKMGFEVEVVAPEIEDILEEQEPERLEDRVLRPPIVTIMGHVDHGKTSLLDAIRLTNVTQSEKGGITQHIGAYQAKIKNSMITFLDTPGHEAFTAMRARGAQVTDIVILVVAADDGIKPQTTEAIDHANAAGVPILVAINKIDKPDAKPEEVKKQLANLGLLPEEWGGQTMYISVSAKEKIGIDALLEMSLLQAEVMELKANPKMMAKGVVIESKLDKGRGPVATVIVQNGTLRVGDPFLVGPYFGKIRALTNDRGEKILSAPPSMPVEIVGLPEVPQPGDKLYVVKDERKARQLSNLKLQKQRETNLAQSSRITMEDLHRQISEGKIQELNLIIKADVQGSIQAVQEAFSKLDNTEVRVKIIHGAVGGITETDVLLSSASNAIIIGFNVRPTEKATHLANREKVDIRLYSIIYDAVNDMKKALDGMLAPKFKEKIIGRAEVRQLFSLPKIGVIAGCQVLSGNLERNLMARVIRDSVVVYQGKISSLRRFKDDVKEVPSGYECGLTVEKFQDLKQGDIVEPFILEEVKV
jgi:translation initiation factor IF-2